MKVIAVTQKGTNKQENEDRIIAGKSVIADGIFQTDISNGIIAIADGVGGNNAGAVASQFVACRLSSLEKATLDGFTTINEELLKRSMGNPQYSKMATTLSGLQITRDKIWLFNIGNTRVYSLQNGKYLKQLTTDDSTLNHLLLAGRLTEEEAKDFNRKNEITACFGGSSRDLFQMKIISIEAKLSSIVITSDGIHDYVSIDRMEEIIAENGISDGTCYLMIDEARANGSQDDASILLCDLCMI